MKRTAWFALTLGLFALGSGVGAMAGADETATQCSVATLNGSYLYSTVGSLDGEPYASAGIMSFDGEGNVAIVSTRSVEREQVTTSGTYTIESACSGSMDLGTGTINHFYLGPDGKSRQTPDPATSHIHPAVAG
jgi:hypothetical protein